MVKHLVYSGKSVLAFISIISRVINAFLCNKLIEMVVLVLCYNKSTITRSYLYCKVLLVVHFTWCIEYNTMNDGIGKIHFT